MFKKIIIVFIISFKAHAIHFRVIGPCSAEPLSEGEYKVEDLDKNIGAVTLEILDHMGLSYLGNENGIHTIENAPYSEEAKEIIDENTVQFHGWAYYHNEELPSELPGQRKLKGQNDTLIWVYSFVELKNNNWGEYQFTYETRPNFLWDKEKYCTQKE